MRKIMIGVLSVAGLLAVVLALASGPATAAVKAVTFTTATAAGKYTISWETVGGCDPGASTSGASGSNEITVTRTDGAPIAEDATPAGTVGSPGTTVITVNNDCTYQWNVSFTSEVGGQICGVGGLPAGAADDTPDAITLTVEDAACFAGGKIVARIVGPGFSASVDGGPGEDRTEGTEDDPPDTEEVPGNELDAGAISETTFTVTATPVSNSHDSCQEVSAETERKGGKTVAELTVVGARAIVKGAATSVNCEYDVEVHLPTGFAGDDDRKKAGVAGTDGGDHSGETPLRVRVQMPNLKLIQNVMGDAGDAYATYKVRTGICTPGLPPTLTGVESGGIISTTTVELRTGRYNISAAPWGNDNAEGQDQNALDKNASACWAQAEVHNLPSNCHAADLVQVNLTTSEGDISGGRGSDNSDDGYVLLEMVITCEAMEDTSDMDDMNGGDMSDTGDMGDTGDDTGSLDTGTDEPAEEPAPAGPPADVPTG